MTENHAILAVVAGNTVIALGYFLWGMIIMPAIRKNKKAKKGSRTGCLIKTLILLLCPVVAPLLFLIGSFFHKVVFHKPVDLSDVIFSKERIKAVEKSDIEKERNYASLEESLLVSDNDNLRQLMMDILRRNDKQKSLGSIAEALNSSDSETSHYAASVLGHELNLFRAKVRKMHEEIRKGDEAQEESGKKAIEYMNRMLRQQLFLKQEHKEFVTLLEDIGGILYDKGPNKLKENHYEIIISQLLETDETKKAERWCMRSKEAYPGSLMTYKCHLKLYYKLKDSTRFFETLNELKESEIIVDNDILEMIRIFQ